MADNGGKIFNRDVRISGGGALYVNDVLVVDSSGNIDAPVTTTNATFSGNTTVGDSSADTNTVNATSTYNSTVTVGVNDTGYDVKFFGATSGKSWLWDESADSEIVTSAAATALVVGANGATNPALAIDASTASSATGIKVKSAAAAGGVAVSATSSGTNENLTLDAKGSGTLTLNGTATGAISLAQATTVNGTFTANGATTLAAGEAVSAGGGANAYVKLGTGGTIGIRFGSGAPSVSAGKGSLYLRTDGSTINDRMYVNTDGGTTWSAVTTAA